MRRFNFAIVSMSYSFIKEIVKEFNSFFIIVLFFFYKTIINFISSSVVSNVALCDMPYIVEIALLFSTRFYIEISVSFLSAKCKFLKISLHILLKLKYLFKQTHCLEFNFIAELMLISLCSASYSNLCNLFLAFNIKFIIVKPPF